MILSIPALNWAAVRSGLGLGDFMASLTPEREEEILVAYNAWRKSKGLKPEDPVSPIFTVAHEKQSEDDLSVMMEAVAEEIEEEEAAEAAEIANTMAEIEAIDVPDDDTPIPDDHTGSGAAASIPNESADSDAAPNESAGNDVVSNESADSDAAAPTSADEVKEALSIEQRISKLPKTPDAALYEELLASMGGDVEALKSVTEAVIIDLARRHRGRTAQKQFLVWLETLSNPVQAE